jgi:hypothetical protein
MRVFYRLRDMSEALSQLHEEQKLYQETINMKDCELEVSLIRILISWLFECICMVMIHSAAADIVFFGVTGP